MENPNRSEGKTYLSDVRMGCLSKLEPNKAKSQGGKGGQGGSVKVCYDPSDILIISGAA